MLDHTKTNVEKMHYIDVELAEHVHKLDVKLQFVSEWLFSVCCARSCQAVLVWSELTNNTLRKQRWGTFLCPQI